jgi:hypothetical protein
MFLLKQSDFYKKTERDEHSVTSPTYLMTMKNQTFVVSSEFRLGFRLGRNYHVVMVVCWVATDKTTDRLDAHGQGTLSARRAHTNFKRLNFEIFGIGRARSTRCNRQTYHRSPKTKFGRKRLSVCLLARGSGAAPAGLGSPRFTKVFLNNLGFSVY